MSAKSFFSFSTSFRSWRLMHAPVHPRVYRRSICVSIERRRETFSIKRRIMKFSTEMPYRRLVSASLRRNDDWFSFFFFFFNTLFWYSHNTSTFYTRILYLRPLFFVSLSLANIGAKCFVRIFVLKMFLPLWISNSLENVNGLFKILSCIILFK